MSFNWGDLINSVGSVAAGVYDYTQKGQAADAMRSASTASQVDPFGQGNREQYQGQLRQLYDDPSYLENLPSYKFAQAQGEKAINRGASKSGQYLGTGRLHDLTDYNQGLATQTYNQEATRLGQLSGSQFGPNSTAYADMQTSGATADVSRGTSIGQTLGMGNQGLGVLNPTNASGGASIGGSIMTGLKGLFGGSGVTSPGVAGYTSMDAAAGAVAAKGAGAAGASSAGSVLMGTLGQVAGPLAIAASLFTIGKGIYGVFDKKEENKANDQFMGDVGDRMSGQKSTIEGLGSGWQFSDQGENFFMPDKHYESMANKLAYGEYQANDPRAGFGSAQGSYGYRLDNEGGVLDRGKFGSGSITGASDGSDKGSFSARGYQAQDDAAWQKWSGEGAYKAPQTAAPMGV